MVMLGPVCAPAASAFCRAAAASRSKISRRLRWEGDKDGTADDDDDENDIAYARRGSAG